MSIKTTTDEKADCILGTVLEKMHILADGSYDDNF